MTRMDLMIASATLLVLGCGEDDKGSQYGNLGTGGTIFGAGGTASSAGASSAGAPGSGGFLPASGGATTAMAGASGMGGLMASGGLSGTSGATGVSGSFGAGGMLGDASTAGPDGGTMTPPDGGSGALEGGNGTPTTGTFPPVDDLSADGPYTARTVNNTGPGRNYTVFHPDPMAPDGIKNPVVSWGNGGFTTPADYPLLPHLASHGFVVVASNNITVTGPEVRAGLDWIFEQNEDSSSPFYEKLDPDKVGGMGYSNGGLATLATADDPRYDTIVIISGANVSEANRTANMPKLHTPIAYLCTDDDASEGNCEGDFAVADVPAFFGVMNGSVHTSVTTLLNLGDPAIMDRLAGATTGWLRWQLMADQTRETMFMGDDCGLCEDRNWTVRPQKNWN